MPMVTRVCRNSSPFHTAEDGDLQRDAADRNREESDGQAEVPAAGRLGHLITDIGAQQIHGPVCEIHVAHQTEDQRETAGHQEIEAGEGDAIEQCDYEDFLTTEGVDKPDRPDRKYHPQ